MSEGTRFRLRLHRDPDMESHPEGEYVRFEDYEAALSQAREERDEELCRCEKCGHQQAEPNWCHECGHRTSQPLWAARLLGELESAKAEAEKAEQALQQARERALDEVREKLLGEEAIHAAAGVDYSPDWPETFDQLPDDEQRTWRQGVHRIITAALESLSENKPQDRDRGGL